MSIGDAGQHGPAFEAREFRNRVNAAKARMAEAGLEALLVFDPANINYLTGYEARSYYTPQCVLVANDLDEPMWIGRAMDVANGYWTTHLTRSSFVSYPDRYISDPNLHAMEYIAGWLADQGFGRANIGVEEDAPTFSHLAHRHLAAGLPEAKLIPADLLVNRLRVIKSDAELQYVREAGQIVSRAMEAASQVIRPGVRECDAAAEIYRTLISGLPHAGGDIPITPNMPAGPRSNAPHVSWTDKPYAAGSNAYLELGGCRHRYHAGLTRTVTLGDPPRGLVAMADACGAALEAALATLRPGATCHDVAVACEDELAKHGYASQSRRGYSIGIGYPTGAWNDRAISIVRGDETPLVRNMTLHIIMPLWSEDVSYMISETAAITDDGHELLSTAPRTLIKAV